MYGSFFGRSSKDNKVLVSLDDDSESHNDLKNSPSANLTSCILNLANTIIGAGMLGLPGAFGGTGWMGGTLLIVAGAAFSAHGLVLLSKSAQQAGCPSSFYTVARAAIPSYTILIDLAVSLKCFGVATGYLITIGDCMVDALDHLILPASSQNVNESSLWIRMVLSRQFWVVFAVLAVLPVSFYRTFDELKRASTLALVFVFFLAFGIVAYAQGLADPCPNPDETCRGQVEVFTTVPRTISKLPIFVFSFTCHQNIFPVVNEIQNRTQARLNLVIFASIGFAFIIFFVVAVEGYRTFGSNVKGDILLNYPETVNLTILRVCIAFMLTLHYPLQLDPSRRCITSLVRVIRQWRRGKKDYSNDVNIDDYESYVLESTQIIRKPVPLQECQDKAIEAADDEMDDNRLFYIITISFLLLSFLLAMIVNDLGIVLAMVGATGSTLVSYVLPGLIYIHLHPFLDVSKIWAYLQLGLGCVIMPVALYFVIVAE